MIKAKTLFLTVLIAAGYSILFITVYNLLQNPSLYNRFFSEVMSTYEIQDNSITVVKKPFAPVTEKSFVENMDAHHYLYIKDNQYNYDPNDEVTRSNFAFFPLFPLAWKISQLSGIGISILNFLLHIASVIILAWIFCRQSILLSLIAVLTLPTLTVFLIPYSEALFMFSISLALLGWYKENKLIYVSGLLCASMTRPVFILLIGSIIATEIFLLLCDKNRKINYQHLFITVATILGGTFIVTLFQRMYHHGSLLTFIDAQKHWGTFLQIPKTIVDWSNEGYGMNVGAMVFCFVFGSVVLISKFIKTEKGVFNYWYYFSWIYLLFATVFVLFLQGGCLHSLYRYTLCTPFCYIIIFQHINNLNKIPIKKIFLIFSLFIACCIVFFNQAAYGSSWGFSKTGFMLLCLNLVFFMLIPYTSKTQKYIGFSLLILASIIWNAYLLNMFVTRAWIFL
ncbi:MAG: hypothetical protein V4608_03795 [Bacteroidota bacterium]